MANSRRSTSQALTAAQVEGFLQTHPDFLAEHPELLTELTVPHLTADGVSSLIERQVMNLRQENRRYREQLEDLSSSQNDIRALSERVHQLALDMLASEQPEVACALLQDCMQTDYHAEAATLFLFLDHNPFGAIELVDVRERHDKLRLLLAELFNHGRPLLDSLQAEHLPLMFGQQANAIHSSILLPISGHHWDGLLTIGSRQRDRYRRGPALELLTFLSRVTAIRLDQWLQSQNHSSTA